MSATMGTWIAGILTVAVWSYLYKQNIVFQVVEHLFIGVSAAHAMTVAYFNIVSTGIKPVFEKGDWALLLPLVGGLLLYAKFLPKISWLSRIPLAFTMGTGAGVAIWGAVDASFIKQISGTMIPLNSIENLLLVAGTIATLVHFLFNANSRKHGLEKVGILGRYTMMIAFGAAYGNTVMMRMSLLIPRMRFVFGTWLGLLPK